MTAQQKETLRRRNERLPLDLDESNSSQEEGPSRDKGKGIDPREWGNVNISRESLDPEAQAAALASIVNPRPEKDGKSKFAHHGKTKRPDHRAQPIQLPAESRPVAQIAPRSYLGTALNSIGQREKKRGPEGGSPYPSDPSSDSDGETSYSSDASSMEEDPKIPPKRGSRSRRGNRHGRNKHRRRRSSSSGTRPLIKPIPPKDYDGRAEPRAYYRFVHESEAYLRDGKVRGRRQVFLLSYYLTGKAYDFYTQRVSSNEDEWTLRQFYDEMFNFCFPIDYRMRLRKDLARCHQNEKSVSEYTHELYELFNMIGDIPERDRVLKFWNGARPTIQKGLWRDNLNPETSSWDLVVAQAEIIEISENVAERRDRRNGSSSQAGGPSSTPKTSQSGNKGPSTSSAARSVSYDTRANTHQRSNNRFRERSTNQHRNHTETSSHQRSRDGPNHNRGSQSQRGRSQTPRSQHSDARSTPRLSEKEKADRLAAGQCFVCGETGHFSRDCPTKRTVKASGSKQPGATAFNIEPVVDDHESDDFVEVLDSLPLGAMAFGDLEPDEYNPSNKWMEFTAPVVFGPIEEWRDQYPRWNEPGVWTRRRIGDCYALVADSILTRSQPFPGDEQLETENLRPELRFRVRKNVTAPEYIIQDNWAHETFTIPKALLGKPRFNLGRWYARRLGDTSRDPMAFQHAEMGRPLAIVAKKLLEDGIRSYYPSRNLNLNPENRFTVYPPRPGREGYLIDDRDMRTMVEIPVSSLEDPAFDLIGWYMKSLSDQWAARQEENDSDLPHECPRTHMFAGCIKEGSSSSDEGENGAPTNDDDDEIPDLQTVSNDSEDDDYRNEALNNKDFWDYMFGKYAPFDESVYEEKVSSLDDKTLTVKLSDTLTACQPFPGDEDGPAIDPTYVEGQPRFDIESVAFELIQIYDRVQGFEIHIHASRLHDPEFEVGRWYAEQCAFNQNMERPWEVARQWADARPKSDLCMENTVSEEETYVLEPEPANGMELGGVQVDRNKYPDLQRNAAQVKGNLRVLPKPITVKVLVNGKPARALLDSGSLGDFVSSTLADQLSAKKEMLASPISLQLAVQGSRSKVNARTTLKLEYQDICENRTFDVININNYDLILGTPFMYQHQMCLGFNPARVVIGSETAMPMNAGADTKLMAAGISPDNDEIDAVRKELNQHAMPLCREVHETELPPLRDINHTIPLIDESKTYPWRPSKCPEAFREQWAEKRDAYLKSGRWEITSSGNTVPMMLIPKPNTSNPVQLRCVVDLRERNKNTHKMTSPLPDMEGMLRRTAGHKYRSTLDLKSAYEQIRVIPEHVPRTTVTTPDGNMVSHVVQQGDCNAPATYQALMNHLFSPYIGRFMDIYLDDIVIYSDTLNEHKEHVKIVLDILERERLYLSGNKIHFLQQNLKLLGRIIDDNGIRMDSDKVDSVLNWKVPTNRDLLRGFIGSVGYLADDIPNVRIPMGVLSAITGDTVPFRWGYTEQRAFDEVKTLVHLARGHHRVPLNYSSEAPPIWMVTDGCSTGISGLVSQGQDWKTAKIAAFYSAKLNPAQQNYPVHEIEMLAGIETMLRHADILQGVKFKWLTDHKGLIHLLNQKNLSGRQARWLEKISSFTFEVVYIAGSENVVADALSRMYSNDSPGTVRAPSEFTCHDVLDDDTLLVSDKMTDMPVLAGIEAVIATRRSSHARKPTEKAAAAQEASTSDVSGSFVRRTPVKRKEGENTVHNSPGTDLPNVPLVVSEPPTTQATAEPIITPDSDTPDEPNPLLVQNGLGIDLLTDLRGRYAEDTFFKVVLGQPKDFRNFESKEGLVYLKENDRRVLCIPKVLVRGRSAREIVISEAHSILAHLGASKTLDYLRDHVWWKDIVSDVKAFCETCHTCKTSKPSNQKPYGLLNPLSAPTYPWESIGMDFVGPLPESGNRDGIYDSITVIICLLTSMVHLVPSRINYNASQLAELMFEHVYKSHGLPKNIVSNRDVLFTSVFWSRLHQLIGTKLRMSSAYHPQSDGATERANRTVTQMLRQCIHANQKDWVTKLPAIEFAINSARSASTGFAPFFLNFGRMPRAMIWESVTTTEYPSIREFANQKKLALMSAHDSILAARVKQTRDANKRRQDVPFKQGDLVYLSSQHIKFPKGLARKLIPKYLGPYRILRDFENASFRIELPQHLKKRGVHDVFHSSLLRIHVPNDDRLFPGRMDTQIVGEDIRDDEWAVDRIKSHAGAKGDAMFEVLWKSGDTTWLPYYQITHLQALTDYLDLIGISKISKLPPGSGQPPVDDPQIFLGALSLQQPEDDNSFSCSLPCNLVSLFKRAVQTVISVFNPPSFGSINSPTVDLDCIIIIMPKLRGINHPSFTRISPTHYTIRDPKDILDSTIHVSQIADYLRFDEQLRAKGLAKLQSIPLGFDEFAHLWNTGARETDPRRISRVYVPESWDEYYVDQTESPVHVRNFFITAEQVGLAPPTPTTTNPAPSNSDSQRDTFREDRELAREYLMDSMEQRRMNREGYAQRKEQRPFTRQPAPNRGSTAPLSRLQFEGKRTKRKRSLTPVRRVNAQQTTTVESRGRNEPSRAPTPSPSEVPQEKEPVEESSNEVVPMVTAN